MTQQYKHVLRLPGWRKLWKVCELCNLCQLNWSYKVCHHCHGSFWQLKHTRNYFTTLINNNESKLLMTQVFWVWTTDKCVITDLYGCALWNFSEDHDAAVLIGSHLFPLLIHLDQWQSWRNHRELSFNRSHMKEVVQCRCRKVKNKSRTSSVFC